MTTSICIRFISGFSFSFFRREEIGSERRASVRESICDITGNGRTEHNAHVARQSQAAVLRSGYVSNSID